MYKCPYYDFKAGECDYGGYPPIEILLENIRALKKNGTFNINIVLGDGQVLYDTGYNDAIGNVLKVLLDVYKQT